MFLRNARLVLILVLALVLAGPALAQQGGERLNLDALLLDPVTPPPDPPQIPPQSAESSQTTKPQDTGPNESWSRRIDNQRYLNPRSSYQPGFDDDVPLGSEDATGTNFWNFF